MPGLIIYNCNLRLFIRGRLKGQSPFKNNLFPLMQRRYSYHGEGNQWGEVDKQPQFYLGAEHGT
jgi:hypothetical protein